MARTMSPTRILAELPMVTEAKPGGGNLEHSDIGARIGADDLGFELALILQGDFDVGGAIDDVIIGQDVAVGADDHARAQAVFTLLARLLLSLPAATVGIAEELAEEWIVFEGRLALALRCLHDF